MSKCGVFSGPYFYVFGLNTGKYRPKTPSYLNTFHAMRITFKFTIVLQYNELFELVNSFELDAEYVNLISDIM